MVKKQFTPKFLNILFITIFFSAISYAMYLNYVNGVLNMRCDALKKKNDSLVAIKCDTAIEIKYKVKYINKYVENQNKVDSVIIANSSVSELEQMLRSILKESWDDFK